MARQPFQVLVLPFRESAPHAFEFAVFRRADSGSWQFIAGGGERAESPHAAASREAEEEAGIPGDARLYRLQACASIPVAGFSARREWPADLFVIPEHAFAVEASRFELRLSSEHTQLEWLSYESCQQRLTWDSNRTALWELRERLALGALERAR
jgi:dATP pyrophosphohydrolase